jgi:hypothetical protein
MNSAKPPRLAEWILQHFGPELNQEALAGDLNEAFQQGRSKGWYWRQVLAAVRWRGLLYTLLIFAAISWWMTSPDMWRRSPLVSRPLDMAIFMAVLLACRYLPGMLRGRLRAELAVLIVVFFCWLYRDHGIDSHDIYSHYNILAVILTYALVFNRKATAPPLYHLTLRELLLGDPFAERRRMIVKLEQSMADETDPEVRQAYAESIAVLRRNVSPAARATE